MFRNLSSGIKAVADPGFSDDIARFGVVRFDLLAELTDKNPQVFCLLYVITAPDSAQENAVRENFVGMLNQVNK